MSEQHSNILPTWTDERIAQLKQLAADGQTASQMAGALGGVTRNGVISKIHRMNLVWNCHGRTFPNKPSKTARPKPAARKRPPSPDRLSVIRAEFEQALEAADLPPEDTTASVPFFEAGEGACRWPLTDPAPISEFRFCGAPQFPGCPYCARHYRMGHQGPQTRARERSERRAA